MKLFLLLSIIVLMVFATPAQAYLEPGTVSMALQLLIALVTGILVSLKLFWEKVRLFLVLARLTLKRLI